MTNEFLYAVVLLHRFIYIFFYKNILEKCQRTEVISKLKTSVNNEIRQTSFYLLVMVCHNQQVYNIARAYC